MLILLSKEKKMSIEKAAAKEGISMSRFIVERALNVRGWSGKMKAHGLLERVDKHYGYRLTHKGTHIAAVFVLFHKRVFGTPSQ